MGFWLFTVLILTICKTAVLGLSTGAPLDACTNGLIPDHTSIANTASGEVPFSVDISDIGDSYTPEEMYTIVLSGGAQNPNFKGFIIQARRVADNSSVGLFVGGDNYHLQCTDTAATHDNSMEKTTISLTWTAPVNDTGPIKFRYAFVDQFSGGVNMFWAELETDMIAEGADVINPTATGVTPTATDAATATATVTPSASPPSDNGGGGGGTDGATSVMATSSVLILLTSIIALII